MPDKRSPAQQKLRFNQQLLPVIFDLLKHKALALERVVAHSCGHKWALNSNSIAGLGNDFLPDRLLCGFAAVFHAVGSYQTLSGGGSKTKKHIGVSGAIPFMIANIRQLMSYPNNTIVCVLSLVAGLDLHLLINAKAKDAG